MSLVDEIDQDVANGVDAETRRQKIVNYVRDRLHDNPLPWTFVRGQFTVVVLRVELYKKWLAIWLYITKAGKEIKLDYPILINKPPLLVADPAGTIIRGTPPNERSYRFDPIEAIKGIVVDLIKNS